MIENIMPDAVGESRRTPLGTVAYVILLAVSVLLPIFFVPVSFISAQFGTSLLFGFGVIVATLAYIVSCLQSGSIDLPRPAKYIVGLTALVPIVYTLAGVANGFSRMSFLGYTFDQGTAGFIFLAFVYMFLVSILFRDAKRLSHAYRGFAGAVIVFAVFVSLRLIFGPTFLSFGVFPDLQNTMIGNWTNVGILFGLVALLSSINLSRSVSPRTRVLLGVSLAVSLFILVTVGVTFLWIVLAISLLLFILHRVFSSVSGPPDSYGLSGFGRRLLGTPRFPLAIIVVSILFALWGSPVSNYLSNFLGVSVLEVRPTLGVTLDIARNTVVDRPLFGSGPNTFVSQWLSFKPDDITSTIFWNTDFTSGIGLIPTFAVTTGIVGVLSWIVFLALYLYYGFKALFARIENGRLKYFVVSSFFLSFYLWLLTFVYVPGTVIFLLTFFFTGLFFASSYAAGVVPVSPSVFSYNPRIGFVSSVIMVACFVGCSALGYGLYQNSLSLWYFQRSSHALSGGDAASAETHMNKAISAVPQDVYYRALSEIELYKLNAILSEDPKTADQTDVQKRFSDTLSAAIKAGLSAKDANPAGYLNWIALARVYESVSDPALKIDGAYESAALAYSEALRRNPKNPAIFVLLSRLALVQGDLQSAGNYALQAIAIKRNYTDAYFLLAQVQIANKDLPGAIQSVEATTVIDPTNPGTFFQLGYLKFNGGDYVGARDALEKAIELTPEYANAKYYLGLSYEALGQHQKAIAEFSDLAESNPDSIEVAAILNNLKSGKPVFSSGESTVATKPPVKEKGE